MRKKKPGQTRHRTYWNHTKNGTPQKCKRRFNRILEILKKLIEHLPDMAWLE